MSCSNTGKFSFVALALLALCGCPSDPGGNDSGDLLYAGVVHVNFQPPGYGGVPGFTGVTSTGFFTICEVPPIEAPDLDQCFLATGGDLPTPVLVAVLDPGDPGQITIDTNTAYIWRQLYTYPGGSTAENYLQDPAYIDADAGDYAQISWPGGQDIEPFAFSVRVLNEPLLSSPAVSAAGAVSIDFDSSLSLYWDTAGEGDYAWVTIMATDTSTGQSEACSCYMRDDGSFTVPAYYLTSIKPAKPFAYQMTMERQKTKQVSVNVAGAGPTPLHVISRASLTGFGYSNN